MLEIYRKRLKTNTIEKISDDGNLIGAWIKVTGPTDDDFSIISKYCHISESDLKSLVDEFERPSIENYDGTTVIVFHIPIYIEGDDSVETRPLVILIAPNNIITITREDTPILTDFLKGTFGAFNTTMKTRFVLLLFKRIDYYFDRYLRTVDKITDEFERNISKYTDNREVHKIFAIKKGLIYFNTAVISNGKVLRKIMLGNFIQIYKEDKEILDDIIIENDQSIEVVSIYNNIITSSLDAYASVVSNNMNVVMKTLTIFTIILATPNLIASLWGMNVRVPFADVPYAFHIILSIAALLSCIVGFWFLRKR